MLTKDAAICIRAVDYSETSQIVTFFTRAAGKINAIAKGSKRPRSAFDGPIEMFSHGKIVFADSTRERLATLTEFEQKLKEFADRIKNDFLSNIRANPEDPLKRPIMDFVESLIPGKITSRPEAFYVVILSHSRLS